MKYLITLALVVAIAHKPQAQTLSERIDAIEYQADHGEIFHGWSAIYWYSNDKDLGWKVAWSVAGGFTVYAFVAPQKGSCKLSWWERRKAKRQFRKRRR